MADGDFDLLGDPIPPGWGSRGRPPHVPTDEKRRIVVVLLAFGRKEEDVAAALGITPPTLRKHYFRELKVRADARARLDAKLLGTLMSEVEKGNVSAVDKMFERLDRHDLAGGPRPEKQARKPKLGKKEQAAIDAANVPETGKWSTLLGN